MYKSDYFTKEQMTTYEMRSDTDKAWTPTLDHFLLLFAQRKVYGDDRATHSSIESATTMYDIPSDCMVATIASSSDGSLH